LATQCYDCFLIFDSNKYNRDPGGVAGTLQQLIEGLGGEILASRLWEERKLAYPINGQGKGTYWITYFKMETNRMTEFNRACQLDENIMRFLVTIVDPRLVETLVAQAKSLNPALRKQSLLEAAWIWTMTRKSKSTNS
jgi:small subunit ribosomal protein S6